MNRISIVGWVFILIALGLVIWGITKWRSAGNSADADAGSSRQISFGDLVDKMKS